MPGRPAVPLAEAIARLPAYAWYHRIEIAPGVFTPSWWAAAGRPLDGIWEQILDEQAQYDLTGKAVLDVGCRDGLFSFAAERQGARSVLGIDNDLSRGATELLIPYFGSRVEMLELNVYDLDPDLMGTFDIVLCYGVLYHLRYPFHGLRKLIGVIEEGGLLLLESGMVADSRFDHLPLLYCPVEESPYAPDWTSCTFFTEKGLVVTLESLGMVLDRSSILAREPATSEPPLRNSPTGRDDTPPETARQFLAFRKDSTAARPRDYWEDTHALHTRMFT